MGIGGVEKALLNFLAVLDKENFDVTLLLEEKDGKYLNQIPSWVKVEEVKISKLKRNILKNGVKATLFTTIKKWQFFSTYRIMYWIITG